MLTAAMSLPLAISAVFSVGSYFMCKSLIPCLTDMFLKAGLSGKDMSKRQTPQIPESMGLVTGGVYLVLLFVFIPFAFSVPLLRNETFRHSEFVEFIAALLSICCMVLLGFADDVLNLRWRHKLMLPTIATLPLLMVYYVNFNSTTVLLPHFVRPWLNGTASLNIGVLYYVYMASLAVFCTNAINILAGINGLEVGQSLIIASSIGVFNVVEATRTAAPNVAEHVFSLYLIMPYIGTTLALWQFNKYPSRVFVGDTFCYLSGMTFAVVGILGHFSKTVLLFFLPQIINFVYSVPQLFHLVPCPRHRLPKYNATTDLLENSVTTFKLHQLSAPGRWSVRIYRALGLIRCTATNDDDRMQEMVTNNFTLINLFIVLLGPQHERRLTYLLCGFQVLCTIAAFVIRYPLAIYFYET